MATPNYTKPASKLDLFHIALLRIKERSRRVDDGETWDLSGYCLQVISDLEESIKLIPGTDPPIDFKPLVDCLSAFFAAQRDSNEEVTLALRDLVEIFKSRDLTP